MSDLGGLGDKQGPPVLYSWAPPSLVPVLVPWLSVLLLLMVPGNRCAQAWWIFLPLGLFMGVLATLPSMIPGMDSTGFGMMQNTLGPLAFGVAAVWLLSRPLAWKHRMLAFLGCLGALVSFGFLAFIMGQLGTEADYMMAYSGVLLGVGVLSMAASLTLTGWWCRRRYHPARVAILSLLSAAATWLVLLTPIFAIMMLQFGGGPQLLEFLGGVGVMSLLCFGVLLPFLLLSFLHPWHRERLKGLLHLGDPPAPPVVEQPVPVQQAESVLHP